MIRIRSATPADVWELVKIYNAAIFEGTSNYSESEEGIATRQQWLVDQRKRGYPVLVAEEGSEVIGFGALTPFHPVSGYRFTVTGQLYVRADRRGQAVGKSLGAELVRWAKENGKRSIIAGINVANTPSIRLHESFGFVKVGYFKQIGYKNDQWHDDICMQKLLLL